MDGGQRRDQRADEEEADSHSSQHEGSGSGSPPQANEVESSHNTNDGECATKRARGSGARRSGGAKKRPAAGDGGDCGSPADGTRAEERMRRRREINRNSQKRIRERRNREMDELRTEAQRLSQENEALLQQVESLTRTRADMLVQLQDLTDRWQQSIAENAWLNRENIQLRNSVQQLNNLVTGLADAAGGGGGSGSGGAAAPASTAAAAASAPPPAQLSTLGSASVGLLLSLRGESTGSGAAPSAAELSAAHQAASVLAGGLSSLQGAAAASTPVGPRLPGVASVNPRGPASGTDALISRALSSLVEGGGALPALPPLSSLGLLVHEFGATGQQPAGGAPARQPGRAQQVPVSAPQ